MTLRSVGQLEPHWLTGASVVALLLLPCCFARWIPDLDRAGLPKADEIKLLEARIHAESGICRSGSVHEPWDGARCTYTCVPFSEDTCLGKALLYFLLAVSTLVARRGSQIR